MRRQVAVEQGAPRSSSSPDAPAPLRIQLLGAFRVAIGSRMIEADAWRLRKAANLFKLLALAPGHRLHREHLMDLLWPDLDPPAAANSLHQALHAARRILDAGRASPGAGRMLRLEQQVLMLQPPGQLYVDIEAFEAGASAARQKRDPATYVAAIALYEGDLLPEDRYEDWTVSRREALRELYQTLLLEVAQLYQARHEPARAIAALERLVAYEPLHEEAHAGLMRLFAASGKRQAALRQYRQLREALRRELDVEPDDASQRLYQAILTRQLGGGKDQSGHARADQNTARAFAPTPGTRQHNLPVPLTSFIGRDHEQAEVQQLLATSRLLTLTGPGGSGKTRLAMEVAAGLVPVYPDGVWLVDLAVLVDAALVPQTVAAVFGIREEPGRSLTATLVDALQAKSLLLIMDNCEHLVAASAHLAHTLLQACAGLRVMATSREALRVPGEITWQVPTLATPDPQQLPSERLEMVDAVQAFEAVRLLLDRIRWRQPAFALTAENAMAIVEICWRLDGIPLALELAAARVAVLSVEQIAEKLDTALSLLGDGSRTSVPRQQTLRATLNWSYRLLSAEQQAVLRRLAVFAGDFGIAAAEAVCGDVGPRPSVLDLLAQLVDKSLVMVDHQAAHPTHARLPETRYHLLEIIRQYALEQLAAGGEADGARARHASFYRGLAEAAEPHLARPDQETWWRRLEREHGNIRRSLAWALDQRDMETALRLGGAMWQFWYARGYQAEGGRWLEQVLAGVAELDAEHTVWLAKALNGAGTIAWSQGDNARARARLEASLRFQRQLGDRTGIASSLHYLGAVAHHEQDYGRAASFYYESLALRRELEDRQGIAYLLNNLGVLALSQNDYARARTLLEESLALNRELGDTAGSAYTLDSLAQAALLQGDYARAQSLFVASLAVMREAGDTVCIGACIDGLAVVAALQGQSLRAARLLGAGDGIRQTMGARLPPIVRERHRQTVERARDQLGEHGYMVAWEAGRALTLEQAILEATAE